MPVTSEQKIGAAARFAYAIKDTTKAKLVMVAILTGDEATGFALSVENSIEGQGMQQAFPDYLELVAKMLREQFKKTEAN